MFFLRFLPQKLIDNYYLVKFSALSFLDVLMSRDRQVNAFFFSGKRPFGVSLLYMGWDKHYGFQLYQSDPSGNYGGWKATCIGNNSAVRTGVAIQYVGYIA